MILMHWQEWCFPRRSAEKSAGFEDSCKSTCCPAMSITLPSPPALLCSHWPWCLRRIFLYSLEALSRSQQMPDLHLHVHLHLHHHLHHHHHHQCQLLHIFPMIWSILMQIDAFWWPFSWALWTSRSYRALTLRNGMKASGLKHDVTWFFFPLFSFPALDTGASSSVF